MAGEGRWLTAENQDKRIQDEQENVEYDGIDVHEGDENRADSTRQVQVTKLQRHRRVEIGENVEKYSFHCRKLLQFHF